MQEDRCVDIAQRGRDRVSLVPGFPTPFALLFLKIEAAGVCSDCGPLGCDIIVLYIDVQVSGMRFWSGCKESLE